MRTVVLGQTGNSVAQYLEPLNGSIVLDDAQQQALDAILEGKANFFVTGKAGCGKTFLMRALVGADPLVMTLAMFLRHRAGRDYAEQLGAQKMVAPKTASKAPRFILEEIGQWSAANFAMLDAALRKLLFVDKPFGGMQIVANGDFAQLSPVGNDPVNSSPLWSQLGLVTIELVRQYRQIEDAEDFTRFLEHVRRATVERRPLPAWSASMLDYFINRLPRWPFLGVTLKRDLCRQRNWEQVHSQPDRCVVTDGMGFLTRLAQSDSAVPLAKSIWN